MYPQVHKRPEPVFSFDRLEKLWQRYPQYHEMTTFSTLEALAQRKQLDESKRALCRENGVNLIEWPYSMEPTEENVRVMIGDAG